MLAWLDPKAGYMPITGYEQAHDVGRWWDAILRLEHATGFSIPGHMEEAMLVNLKRLTENPARLLVADTPGGGEVSINPHYEDDQLRVTQSRTDEAVVRIEPKTAGPLRIRIPTWTPADSVRVSVGGQAVHPPHLGEFLYLNGERERNGGPITLRYALPARTTEEPCDKTVWRLTWQGDTVLASVPLRPDLKEG